MKIIEPCCAQRQFRELRSAIAKNGTAEFQGYGDLSLTELLPAMLMHYDNTELLIAAPALPDQAAEVIARWMRIQWPRMDGKGKVPAVRRLTLVADLSGRKSPEASRWLSDNPFPGRLTLVDRKQEDTAILLPDLAVTGPVNMRYGRNFTAAATGVPADVAALWRKFTERKEDAETGRRGDGKTGRQEDEETGIPEAQEAPEDSELQTLPASAKKEKPGPEAGQESLQEDDAQTIN